MLHSDGTIEDSVSFQKYIQNSLKYLPLEKIRLFRVVSYLVEILTHSFWKILALDTLISQYVPPGPSCCSGESEISVWSSPTSPAVSGHSTERHLSTITDLPHVMGHITRKVGRFRMTNWESSFTVNSMGSKEKQTLSVLANGEGKRKSTGY